MKKTIYTLALGALLLAGCSQEESLPTGEAVKMTFTANLSTGIQSRADGEAIVSVDKLICAVFKQETNGEQVSLVGEELIRDTVDVDVTTGKATFTPTLLKGYQYGIVFWAYKEGSTYYNTKNLANITFTPTTDEEPTVVDENLIVYTCTKKNVSTSVSGNDLKVTLTRPLAQVNIATTENDWNMVETMGGGTPSKAIITLTGCSNKYNALTGEYGGNETFVYTINLDDEKKLSGTENILLGTGYTFPGSNVNCSISVMNHKEISVYSTEIPNLPTDGNYRTNIVPSTSTDEEGNTTGGLMTGSVSYEVTISEGYTETVNKTPEELEEEANQNNQGNNE